MAHGNYNCCAFCDCKMEYAGMSASTKARICTGCLKRLHAVDVNVFDSKELVEWIRENDKELVKEVLEDNNFSTCFYNNLVDEAVKEKGIEIETNKG